MTTKLKPGEFLARCNLSRPHVVSDLPEYLRREYAEKGWKKATRTVYRPKLRSALSVEVFLEPLCDGLETTDKAEFERHMREVHRKAEVRGEAENWVKSIKRGWVTPKAKREGAPLIKAITESTIACPECGLVMETGSRYADELYIREHLEFCAAEAGAA